MKAPVRHRSYQSNCSTFKEGYQKVYNLNNFDLRMNNSQLNF
jgi:hypothetical protein